jgi:hypothetical protein
VDVGCRVHGLSVRGFRSVESEYVSFFVVVVMSRRTSDDFHTFCMQHYLDHL